MGSDDAADFRSLRTTSPVSRRDQFRRLAWAGVEMTLYRGSFHTWSRWRAALLRLFGAQVGPRCTIRRTSRVYYPWKLSMGADSSLGDRCEVYNLGPISIGERVSVSQEAMLCGGTHDYTRLAMPLVTRPIVLKDDAWVCARAFVGPGVTVGEGAIIGACAVAARDVPDWTIVAGNPATFRKHRGRPT
ncbi:MAG: putative colanic acid biosynthesis acetyltransferase [Phycisphaerales bacterium]|nr:putative colanic acid biosynthesis acetyltransferase [Phycisphaerales bacterium]